MNVVDSIYSNNAQRQPVNFSRTREPISLIQSLHRIKKTMGPGIIMEYKRRSPSGFMNLKYPSITEYFSENINRRTAGLSVLTEPQHFRGRYEDISACQGLNKPILDKDFISTDIMVRNAYNSGADAILLIMDFLPMDVIKDLVAQSVSLGMEALIEFHDLKFLDRLEPMDHVIYGYNRRNLVTLKMEPQEETVLDFISATGTEIVLESGIDRNYLDTHDVGKFAGLLIGSSILENNLGR